MHHHLAEVVDRDSNMRSADTSASNQPRPRLRCRSPDPALGSLSQEQADELRSSLERQRVSTEEAQEETDQAIQKIDGEIKEVEDELEVHQAGLRAFKGSIKEVMKKRRSS